MKTEIAPVYRGMDRAALDAALNNGAAVPEWPDLRNQWQTRSDELRARFPDGQDLRYGDRPRNRLDWFSGTAPDLPILVFVHGGYWQWNDKETFGFIAEGALRRGLGVVNVEYTLAPAIRIGAIIEEIGAALDFIEAVALQRAKRRPRFCLAGHSAGGHLVEHHRARDSVVASLAISGIFDLEPIGLSYLNAALDLSAAEVDAYSPIRHPITGGDLIMTVGGAELPELIRQTARYRSAAVIAQQRVSMISAPGRNHFDILEDLADPDGSLLRAVLDAVS